MTLAPWLRLRCLFAADGRVWYNLQREMRTVLHSIVLDILKMRVGYAAQADYESFEALDFYDLRPEST